MKRRTRIALMLLGALIAGTATRVYANPGLNKDCNASECTFNGQTVPCILCTKDVVQTCTVHGNCQ